MAEVRVRDLQTKQCRNFGGETSALLVPWDLSNVTGPCFVDDDLTVRYRDTTGEHVARSKAVHLGDCHPGTVVLVQYDDTRTTRPNVWWLVEVDAIDGHNSPED